MKSETFHINHLHNK